MINSLKKILVHLMAGANVMFALMMLLCGLTTYVSPADFPFLALFGLGFPLLLIINILFVFFWLIFYLRYIWIALVGILLSSAFIYEYCPVNISRRNVPEGSLKLITYNTESFGHQKKDDDGHILVLEYLANSDADIICMQEGAVSGKLKAEYIDSLMLAAGYKTKHIGDENKEKLRFYSKMPVISAEKLPYDSETNGSVAVKLLYNNDTILLINNHFESYKLTAEDKKQYKDIIKDPEDVNVRYNSKNLLRKMSKAIKARGPQVDSVFNYISRQKYDALIVCGDFNDVPNSYSCNRFSSILKNAFVESGNGLGISYNQRGFYFRIDHVFVSDYWNTYNTHVDKSIEVSDHYPMITYLKQCKN